MTPHYLNDIMNIFMAVEDLAPSGASSHALKVIGNILDRVEIGFDSVDDSDVRVARKEYEKCLL